MHKTMEQQWKVFLIKPSECLEGPISFPEIRGHTYDNLGDQIINEDLFLKLYYTLFH